MQNVPENKEPELNFNGVSGSELKHNAFRTPNNYFEDLTPRVMQSVREAGKVTAKGPDWISVFRLRVLAPSFSIAIIVFLGFYFMRNDNSNELDFQQIVMTMSLEELDLFVEFEPSELLAYDLVNYGQFTLEENAMNGIEEHDVIEYLMDEDEFELNTIIDELEI